MFLNWKAQPYTFLHGQGVRSMHVWWAEFRVRSDNKSHSGQNVVTSSSLVAFRWRAGSTLAHRVAFRCSLGQGPLSVVWYGCAEALWLP